MGRNDVEKITLLRTIMGLDPMASGQIVFNNRLINELSAEQRSMTRIGYMPQGRQIFPLLTIEESLLTRRLLKARKKTPDFVCERFPVLASRSGQELSDDMVSEYLTV